MKYDYREGLQKAKSKKWVYIPVIGLVAGLYLLVNVIAPNLPDTITGEQSDATVRKLVATQPNQGTNRVYIPKINIDVAIVQIEDEEKGAINRSPDSGNPKEGGNYVLAAHRFSIGLTPGQTRAKSPFYHVDQLNKADDIYVDYNGVRYAYKVEERSYIKADATEVEARSSDAQLTLYSSELSGPSGSREVVIAKQTGTIVWIDGKPKLKTL